MRFLTTKLARTLVTLGIIVVLGTVGYFIWLNSIPVTAEEVIPEGEEEVIDRLVAMAVKAVDEHAARGEAVKRDAHAKAHGCVKGIITVSPDLDDELRQGIFSEPGRTYKTWIRFSNGTHGDDREPDARGMAIKVMGVEGKKLLEAEQDEQTQDFVMINWHTFFNEDVWEYEEFFIYQVREEPFSYFIGLFPPRLRPIEMYDVIRMYFQNVADPLDANYFTMSPYKYGPHNAKFSAEACEDTQAVEKPDEPGPDFLRKAMRAHLADRDACFDLKIQLQDPDAAMPIEDPTITWSEWVSPYRTVARLEIPKQAFDIPAQREFCEQLSFTPWHAIPAHRPIGGINRSRKAVYEAISLHRHKMNRARRAEPESWCLEGESGTCEPGFRYQQNNGTRDAG